MKRSQFALVSPRGERKSLGPYLESVFDRYHRTAYLSPDPLALVHGYDRDDDIEIAGLVAALLAFGRVEGIVASVRSVLTTLGPHPAGTVRRFRASREGRLFRGFVHRWCRDRDLVALLASLRRTLERWGSLENLFLSGYERGASIQGALARFASGLRENVPPDATRSRGLAFLLPDPSAGSACKRLNLYLRWMVRRDDLDRGIWRSVCPADLVMPIDTHVARISRNLGLTGRKTADWKMADEVTASLRRVDPDDPVRFDFALCRLGILDECPRRQDRAKCRACELKPVCLLYRSMGREVRGRMGGPARW